MLFKCAQSLKTPLLICVSPAGIDIYSNGHIKKASEAISVIISGSFTDDRLPQQEKALNPIDVTPSGMMILDKFPQLKNK